LNPVRDANPAERGSDNPEAGEHEPPARFQSWRGFLVAAIAVNALFAWGMLGQMADPHTSTWYKALIWLPFNAIATAVYLAIMSRLARGGGEGAGGAALGRLFYGIVCISLIVANWVVMFAV
jgi:hypothetical protein